MRRWPLKWTKVIRQYLNNKCRKPRAHQKFLKKVNLKGQQLYAKEHGNEILKEISSIVSHEVKKGSTEFLSSYRRAVGQVWDKLDNAVKEEYNQKASDLASGSASESDRRKWVLRSDNLQIGQILMYF